LGPGAKFYPTRTWFETHEQHVAIFERVLPDYLAVRAQYAGEAS